MPAPSLAAIKSHELTAGGLAVHLDCICRGKLTNIGGERGDGELGMGRGRGNSDQDFPRAGVFAKRNGNKDNKRTTPKKGNYDGFESDEDRPSSQEAASTEPRKRPALAR
jgi:hypothetical protein